MAFVIVRRTISIPIGTLGGLLASLSISEGIWRAHGPEVELQREAWSFFIWSDHYLWRMAASGAAAWIGGYVAGTFARKSGVVVGVLSATPAMLAWLWVAISGATGRLLFFLGDPSDSCEPAWGIAGTALACLVINAVSAGAGGRAAEENVGSDEDVARLGVHLLYMTPLAVVGLAFTGYWTVVLARFVVQFLGLGSGPTDPLFHFSEYMSAWESVGGCVLCAFGAGLPWFGLNAAREFVLGTPVRHRLLKALGASFGGVLVTLILIVTIPPLVMWLKR